jgi:hypothetical protein
VLKVEVYNKNGSFFSWTNHMTCHDNMLEMENVFILNSLGDELQNKNLTRHLLYYFVHENSSVRQ